MEYLAGYWFLNNLSFFDGQLRYRFGVFRLVDYID